MKNNSGVLKYYGLSFIVIILDEIVKMLVHRCMILGSNGQIKILGNFFKLHYLTNPGMAFGMELPFEHAKVFLTLFRLIAMVAIGYYLFIMFRKPMSNGFLICISMILGGAIGNLIDSIF